MGRKGSKEKQSVFNEALKGKKIPILTLDNKWYRLLDLTKKAHGSFHRIINRAATHLKGEHKRTDIIISLAGAGNIVKETPLFAHLNKEA